MPLRVENFSTPYKSDGIGSHFGKATSPTFLNMWGSLIWEHNRAISILETQNNKDTYIRFNLYNVGHIPENDRDRASMFSVEKANLQSYLDNAEILENGKKGVYFEVSQLRNQWAEMLVVLQLFGARTHAKLKVEMIFTADDKLEKMRVHEEYQGERVLFSAANLRSEHDIRSRNREIAQKNRTLTEEQKTKVENKRRFNF